MKAKYTLTVAGTLIRFVSDEDQAFVKEVVKEIDENITTAIVNSSKITKIEAAILCALDYCSEKNKADKKIKNLEAQISLYEETIRRLKTKSDTEKIEKAQVELPEIAINEEKPLVVNQTDGAIADLKEEQTSERSKEKEEKLRQIEALLRSKR